LLNKQDDKQDEEQPPAATESDSSDEQLNVLETKFSHVETKIDKLTAAFAKAAGTPAEGTTDGEEAHLGDNAKMNDLL
jgi:hypothetical protein